MYLIILETEENYYPFSTQETMDDVHSFIKNYLSAGQGICPDRFAVYEIIDGKIKLIGLFDDVDPINQGKSELMRRFAELNNVKVTDFGTKEDFLKKYTE